MSNLGLEEEGVGLSFPRGGLSGGRGRNTTWPGIDWNAFSEALGQLKFYICRLGGRVGGWASWRRGGWAGDGDTTWPVVDRKSTRLNSSHRL